MGSARRNSICSDRGSESVKGMPSATCIESVGGRQSIDRVAASSWTLIGASVSFPGVNPNPFAASRYKVDH